jgi:uncharacterized protein involved in exopolysaccharide biosynthesis
MTLIDFLRIIGQHLKLITIVSVLSGVVVFLATQNTKKEYTSHTLINTGLVSGYNIKSSSGGKVDYAFTNNEMENLLNVANSYEMMEALATNLLTQYLMLNEPDSLMILPENYELLQEEIGGDFFAQITDKNSFDKTLNNVLSYRDRQEENPVNALIYSKNDYFGIEHLENLQINRERSSDMIRFKYSTTDPGVCRQTLVTLTNLFIQKQINIKSGQSTDVLAFFEKATRESSSALKVKEDELLQFMVRNKIINYYEQTRFIASKKEELDEMFFKEQMKLAAADSALSRVKSELSNRFQMPDLNQNLLKKQAELTKASTKMARYESMVEDSLNAYNPQLEALRQQVKNIKSDIQSNAVAAFAVQRTPEGAEMKDLLTQWLNQLLNVEQATARLQVFRKRKKEFDETYQKFAPWGSKLKRIEREIDVAERAYLENLHSYNQARLHQHSMMMSTNLKVVDAPFFSSRPESSKRGLLIIVAILGGLILSIGSLVALELMDGTLKTPLNATNTIGIELLGAFPFFPKNWENHATINFSSIYTKSFGQLYQNIKLGLHNLPSKEQPRRLTFFSTRNGEGKSFMAAEMVNLLRQAGERVLFLLPDEDHRAFKKYGGEDDNHFYPIDHTFFEKQSETELMPHLNLNMSDFDFVILEIPGLLSGAYPVDLVANSDLSVLVTRANRSWNTADISALERFSKGVTNTPQMILNAARIDSMEETLGELPKKRNKIRRFFKKIAGKNIFTKENWQLSEL